MSPCCVGFGNVWVVYRGTAWEAAETDGWKEAMKHPPGLPGAHLRLCNESSGSLLQRRQFQ